MSAPQPSRPGDPQRLGRYAVLGRLGEGGMGVVHLGQAEDGRLVAIKVIREEYAADPGFVERFRREAQAARRVARFCTAQVLDVSFDAERPFLVTEYVEGPTLEAQVRRHGPLAASSLEGLAVGVAAALTAIHAAGLIHRDLKPGNVLLSATGPRVIDFGIVRAADLGAGLTRAGVHLGTPAFMAPEQFEDGAELTAAADVFAWGGVVAYAGTGRLPFGEGPVSGVAYRVVKHPPDLEGLDHPLRELVEAAMAKDPARRPSAQALLLRLLAGPAAAAAVPAAVPPAPATHAAVTRVLHRTWAEPAAAEHPTIPPRQPTPTQPPPQRSAARSPQPPAAASAPPPQAQRPQAQRPQAQPPQAQRPRARPPHAQRSQAKPRRGAGPAAPSPQPWGAGLPPPGRRRGRRAWPAILLIVLVLLLLNALSRAAHQGDSPFNSSPGPGGPAARVAAAVAAEAAPAPAAR
jgi:serine/threonine protein kinase